MNEGFRLLDELLSLSREAVDEGARLVAWPEGVLITAKGREEEYIDRVRTFAREHNIYLFFPLASIFKGDAKAGAPSWRVKY